MQKLGFDERAMVEKAGMRYVQVPFGPTPPKDEELAAVMKLLGEARPNARVLLHCASSNRVGYVWGLYQAKKKGLAVGERGGGGEEGGDEESGSGVRAAGEAKIGSDDPRGIRTGV
jgi:protein tyrosine phosphatase (PTP) superfamily phosphohydrolase (DUF442 family)